MSDIFAEVLAQCPHGMTADFCRDCKYKPRHHAVNERSWALSVPDTFSILSPAMRARYGSDCVDCNQFIAEGDVIGKRDGLWVCEECARDWDLMDKLGDDE